MAFFGMRYLSLMPAKSVMISGFIWCFCQWVGEEAEGKIVAVRIVILIVLLSGGGRGGLEWIFARDGAGGNSVE